MSEDQDRSASNMGSSTKSEYAVDSAGYTKISPTDISQFIRLEQCQRYLRLRLHERAHGRDFLANYGVFPQTIPPLLTRSGQSFEDDVEKSVSARFTTRNLASEGSTRRESDNDLLEEAARTLLPGAVIVLFQLRLDIPLGDWWFRGAIDILRLERAEDGTLHLLIADMKSSAEAKTEHRLQVAFYHEMLAGLFTQQEVPYSEIKMGILYRGSVIDAENLTPSEAQRLEEQRVLATEMLGVEDAFLEIAQDAQSYIDSVHDLVTSPGSSAERITQAPFGDLSYHLTHKCDGCFYNEFCMKSTAEQNDLSLVPHLTGLEKETLRRKGLNTVFDLALLKDFKPRAKGASFDGLQPAKGREDLARQLSGSWGVGHRLDELVLRSRRYLNWKKYPVEAIPYIPSKGHGSLPYCGPDHNPNLVRIYIDAQHDYLNDRIYLLGSLVVASEGGIETARGRRSIVRITEGPPDTPEKEQALLVEWIEETLRAVVEMAAPGESGELSAPIHLIFFNRYEQRVLLDALARHLPTVMSATALYDFLTQTAGFDSPISTFLDEEIRDLKNYPMLCQSLQAVAAFLKFDWRAPENYRATFRERMFDFWGKLEKGESDEARDEDTVSAWYTNRSRFKSELPLEYAYAAWNELPLPDEGKADSFEPYRKATVDLIVRFQARRLEAVEHIVREEFRGNKLTTKSAFRLPDLATFSEKAPTLAHALEEFVIIERHVTMAGWKAARNIAPERRVLMGETLLARYSEEDQVEGVAEQNRENELRRRLNQEYRAAFKEANPGAKQVRLTSEQKAASGYSQVGMRYRLRLETASTGTGLDEVLGLTNIREGERVILFPRYTCDSRLPPHEQQPQTPTPKQLLYGPRVQVERIVIVRDEEGRAQEAFIEIEWQNSMGGDWSHGFVFAAGSEDRPLVDGTLYTLDPDINDITGYWAHVVATELCTAADSGNEDANTLYSRLFHPEDAHIEWGEREQYGQARFYKGLERFHELDPDLVPAFEVSKRDYISSHGDDPVLLVQGPPGTGKSYSTSFAIFARMQGAMLAERDFRVFISCKTHAATDVLLENVSRVQSLLLKFHREYPAVFAEYFDLRLLEIALFRIAPKQPLAGTAVTNLSRERDKEKGEACNAEIIMRHNRCVVASTPGQIYQMVKAKWSSSGTKGLFGNFVSDLAVIDEASQMSIPEAAMSALLLKPGGQLIVVGDHRQMAPIVKHSWDNEPRRTFKAFKTYRSLFMTLLEQETPPPMIKFAESFRLHSAVAEFLRQEIYSKDNIHFHSNRTYLLPTLELTDPFVAAVLAPEYPLVVVVHNEAASQTQNAFEQWLIAPVLEALSDSLLFGLDARDGLGVVVPHRAQRAGMQSRFPELVEIDPQTGTVTLSAVDTVERFQGSERTAMLYSATESDREYLLASGKFLFDPNRLTVAISRAKRKMILVASRSVFSLFSPDEEAFVNAQLWKNLLRRTCTVKLWEGERDGKQVEVWGNQD